MIPSSPPDPEQLLSGRHWGGPDSTGAPSSSPPYGHRDVERLRRWLLLVFVAGACYFLVFGGRHSLFDLRRLEAEVEQERQALSAAEAELERAHGRIGAFRSEDDVLERRARERYGLIRDGELLLRFVPVGRPGPLP